MDSAVRHPRTLAVIRAVLYLLATAVAVGLLLLGLSVLGASVVVAGLALLLTGDAPAVGLAVFAVVGVLTTGGLAVGVGVVARRLDRRVTASDRRPDPLDELAAAYVAGEIDERTLERRVERVLVGGSTGDADRPTGRLARPRHAVGLVRGGLRRRTRASRPDRETESELA
ncbi:hypothetical protein [Salinigranum marinum]|uniref:hypothetical protein n=1 Tax=Salinigranum marinum TaxID=1515595 RepID=UPI0029899F9B|nr:hypothetical protein [Salinigranum marinum]